MIGLPEIGQKVKVYPMPGRRVQDGPRPLDSGGRWLTEPREVVWSSFHLEQYRSGDLLLHPLPAPKAEAKAAKEAK